MTQTVLKPSYVDVGRETLSLLLQNIIFDHTKVFSMYDKIKFICVPI